MDIERQLKTISRGQKYFRWGLSLCQLGAVLVSIALLSELWPDLKFLRGWDLVWGLPGVLALVAVRVFPLVLLGFGFHYLERLFKAVHSALEELSATI